MIRQLVIGTTILVIAACGVNQQQAQTSQKGTQSGATNTDNSAQSAANQCAALQNKITHLSSACSSSLTTLMSVVPQNCISAFMEVNVGDCKSLNLRLQNLWTNCQPSLPKVVAKVPKACAQAFYDNFGSIAK